MRKVIFALIIIFTFIACSNEIVVNESPFETIEIDQVDDYVADGQEIDEYETGHIPGTVNASLSTLEVEEFSPLNKDDEYVIICLNGNRSMTASTILIDYGYDVVNVKDGMLSWTGKVEK